MYYLYVKLHTKTRLKYFGMTQKKTVRRYLGSGVYWSNHIRKHGKEHVITLQVWEFDTQEACQAFAQKFSRDNRIAESDAWANLVDESGSNGWPKTWPVGSHAGAKNGMFGRKHTDEVKQAQSRRLADTNSRSRWYTDGTNNRFTTEAPGPEWRLGRSNHNVDKRWFNNGVKQTFALEAPAGWVEGPLPFKLKWFTDGKQNMRAATCPEGWRPGLSRNSVMHQLV